MSDLARNDLSAEIVCLPRPRPHAGKERWSESNRGKFHHHPHRWIFSSPSWLMSSCLSVCLHVHLISTSPRSSSRTEHEPTSNHRSVRTGLHERVSASNADGPIGLSNPGPIPEWPGRPADRRANKCLSYFGCLAFNSPKPSPPPRPLRAKWIPSPFVQSTDRPTAEGRKERTNERPRFRPAVEWMLKIKTKKDLPPALSLLPLSIFP